MTKLVEFDEGSPARLAQAGLTLDFRSPRRFAADFSVERPCVVQGSIFHDLPFSMGAFSASFGGRLRNVRIGRYCSISGGVQTGWDEHPIDWITSSMVGYVPNIHNWEAVTGSKSRKVEKHFASMRGVTTIGNDVWIGYGVFLRAGVHIGDGAIIAAQSVVLSDIPPYAIVGGSPAKIIRLRFELDTIHAISQLKWWRYNLFDLDQNMLAKPTEFIRYFSELLAKKAVLPFETDVIGADMLGQIAGVAVRDV